MEGKRNNLHHRKETTRAGRGWYTLLFFCSRIDLDKKLREMLAPFCWISERGRYTLSLDAGLLNTDCFARNHMLGNGYDWEKVAAAFLEKQGIDFAKKFSFDCEADTFSVTSSSKKMLKEFSIAFHKFVMDISAFEEFLKKLS